MRAESEQPGQAGGQFGQAAAVIEVDLATMSQSKLAEKTRRYLAYADDRAWIAHGLPRCPPLLLLTTKEARVRTWLRTAARALAAHRRARGLDYRYAGRGRAGRDIADADRLVIAACGHVRDPATAITDRVWLLAPSDPDGDVVDVHLAQLLADRVTAAAVAPRR